MELTICTRQPADDVCGQAAEDRPARDERAPASPPALDRSGVPRDTACAQPKKSREDHQKKSNALARRFRGPTRSLGSSTGGAGSG
jgi:hypothetical protein